MGKSKIEWCDRTWNPITGCTPISAGCANCYAKRMSERFAGPWGLDPEDPFKVTLHQEKLLQPIHWKNHSKVFVCSMSDLFHDDVPTSFLDSVFTVIAAGRKHTFLILTKRPERMKRYMDSCQTGAWETGKKFPWDHVWLGVTAENQEQADKRIPVLLQTPAAKRFVSVEPMLGPVDLRRLRKEKSYSIDAIGGLMESNEPISINPEQSYKTAKLDWVIAGGESGPGARPMHPDWVRSLRDQCQAAGTPFLFKQWGAQHIPGSALQGNVWKEAGHNFMERKGGRLLDGVLWDQYPKDAD